MIKLQEHIAFLRLNKKQGELCVLWNLYIQYSNIFIETRLCFKASKSCTSKGHIQQINQKGFAETAKVTDTCGKKILSMFKIFRIMLTATFLCNLIDRYKDNLFVVHIMIKISERAYKEKHKISCVMFV